MKYIQNQKENYLYKWKLEFGPTYDNWFFHGDNKILKSILEDLDSIKNDESILINNFTDLNNLKSLLPKEVRLSDYIETNDHEYLKKAKNKLNKDLKILENYMPIIKYHSDIKKIRKIDDSFSLSKKMLSIREEILETSIDIWEDYTKVRMSELEKSKKRNIQEFLTILGLLEGSNIKDGDSIKNTSCQKNLIVA